MGTAETMLTEMLEMLEGVPSFLALWSDLEDFCWSLEHPENAGLSGAELARAEIGHRHSSPAPAAPYSVLGDVNSSSEDPNEHRTIGGFARRTINNLLRSVPNIRCVLQVFRAGDRGLPSGAGSVATYKAAHFLLFIHFVMACLHRRSHLRHSGDGAPRYPFCRDRCDAAGPRGPGSEALARLEELRRRLLQPRYDAIVVHDRQLVDFDPRDVMQIRIEHAQLLREAAVRRREQAECQQSLDDALARLGESQEAIERKLVELQVANRAREQAAVEHERLHTELVAAQTTAARAHDELATTRAAMTGLRASGEQAQAELAGIARELSAKETRLAEALNRCVTQEALLRDRGAELARLTASEEKRDARMRQLECRSDAYDTGMVKVMAQIELAMAQCLEDLDVIDRAAWRIPADRLKRLTTVLGQWREWGAQRHTRPPAGAPAEADDVPAPSRT